MFKTIIKEAGIVILIFLAVALILGIIFYEYIPNNKTVPTKIQAYNFPEEVQQELKDSVLEEQNIVRTYYIDSSDLNLYESTKEYDKGKANPFADYSSDIDDTNTNTINNNDTSKGNSNSNNVNSVGGNTHENEVYITTPGKNY